VAATALVITAGAGAADRPSQGRTVSWTQTSIGAQLKQPDGSLVHVASFKNSLDGEGALVGIVTPGGKGFTDTDTRYQADGVLKAKETGTLGTPAGGMVPFTGTGTCIAGGTGVHKHETCNYTFTGTLNPTTNEIDITSRGTSTR
jgi:hypothetical protein